MTANLVSTSHFNECTWNVCLLVGNIPSYLSYLKYPCYITWNIAHQQTNVSRTLIKVTCYLKYPCYRAGP